ncbi:MAG: peptidyl-prolyl cis-trans isomerase SurA [Roseivirga sp.]|jgi:peptidyl-prolyl cis-trans isomerase SurA
MQEQKKMKITRFINRLFTTCLIAVITLNIVSAQGEVVDKIVAKVDNYIILKSEVEQNYASFLASGQAASFNGDGRCLVIRKLVEDKLLLAMAEIDSVFVDPSRVEYELQGRMQRILQQYGSEREILEAYGKTVDQFMEELRPTVEEQMKVREQEDFILSTVTVTPADIRRFFNTIPKDSLPLYSTEYEIGVILKKPEPNAKVVQGIKDKLNSIRDRVLKGEDFEIMAIEYSQGPSGPKGGNLGFATRGSFDPAFEAGALALKPGEISMPVVSSFGVHLIQLLEKRGNEFNTRHILLIPKSTENDVEKTRVFLDSLRTLILQDSLTFSSVAKEYSDDESTSSNGGYLTGQFGSNKIPADALDPTMFFKVDEMKEGDISEPEIIQLDQTTKALQMIYFKSKISPHRANMSDDYEKLRSATLQMKKAERRADYLKEKKQEVYVLVDPEYNRCGITNN